MFSLLKAGKVTRVLNAVAAGTTTQNGTALDMTGFDSVMFVAAFGALTATQVTYLKAQQGALADGSDAADLAGTKVGPLADADSNKLLILEVVRPTAKYVRPSIVRGTANAVIDGIWAIQFNADKEPVTQPTSVSASEIWASPPLGTA